MEFTNGSLKLLYIKQGEVYLPIGCLTDNSFSESVEMLDTTVRTNTNGWKSSRPVSQSYNIDFSGLVPSESLISGFVTYYQLQVIKRNRELLEWKIEAEEGAVHYGEGYITSLGDSATIDEFVSFSANLVGQGEPRINPDISGALDNELNMEI
tara:strand:- start:6 stop:464 length:459 start_codon:yes stop_codon:yes gene_type:complete